MFLLLLIAPKQKNFCVTKDRVPLRGSAVRLAPALLLSKPTPRVAVPCFCFGRRCALAKDRPLPLLRFGCFCRRQRLSCAARRPFNVSPGLRARPFGALNQKRLLPL